MTSTRQTKERILPLQPVFCAIGNKNAGNTQQNARRERLFIRKSFSAPRTKEFGRGYRNDIRVDGIL